MDSTLANDQARARADAEAEARWAPRGPIPERSNLGAFRAVMLEALRGNETPLLDRFAAEPDTWEPEDGTALIL